jgi:hypothetical protein
MFAEKEKNDDTGIRVARRFVFKPKIQIWVNFGWSCNGRSWYILWTLGPFYEVFCYILWTLAKVRGNFFPVWVFCTKKNLATLMGIIAVGKEIWKQNLFRIFCCPTFKTIFQREVRRTSPMVKSSWKF